MLKHLSPLLTAIAMASLAPALADEVEPVATGMLTVETDIPGASVEFAGRVAEIAEDEPVTLCVRSGPHTIKLTDDYATIEREALVPADGEETVSINLADLSPSELHAMGDGRFRQGEHEASVPFFRAASEAAPYSAAYRNDLGLALHLAGETEEARDVLESATRINPGSAAAHFNLATTLVALGEREAALWEYQQARRIKPMDADIQNDLAATLYELGWTARALEEYRSLVEAHPDHGNGWFGYAVVLEQSGQPEEAVEAWHKFLAVTDATKEEPLVRVAEERLKALGEQPESAG